MAHLIPLLLVLNATASSLPTRPPPCESCYECGSSTILSSLEYTFTLVNLAPVTTPLVAGSATSVALAGSLGVYCCLEPDYGPDYGTDIEGYAEHINLNCDADLNAHVCGGFGTAAQSVISVDASPFSGSWDVYSLSTSNAGHSQFLHEDPEIPDCEGNASWVGVGIGGLGINTSVNLVPTGPNPSVVYSGVYHFAAISLEGCFCPRSSPGPGPFQVIVFDQSAAQATDGTSNASNVFQGVVVITDTGATTRLGFLNGTEFTSSGADFGGDKTFSHGFSFVPTTISFSTGRDSFAKHDGNVDASYDGSGNATICWTDRADFISRMGKSIGTLGYTPRADIDLDGDIDSTDYALYVPIFNANACEADFNCNGTVDSADFFAYYTEFGMTTLLADFNGDGTTNSTDFFAFLAAWYGGC